MLLAEPDVAEGISSLSGELIPCSWPVVIEGGDDIDRLCEAEEPFWKRGSKTPSMVKMTPRAFVISFILKNEVTIPIMMRRTAAEITSQRLGCLE